MHNQSAMFNAFQIVLQFPFYLLLLQVVISFISLNAFQHPPRSERDVIVIVYVRTLLVMLCC